MIKKCILLGLACIFSTISVAQEKAEVTLYEYGRPLTNCDANFENLFANFHKYIDDRGIAVRFLSYEKTGVVKNKRQVRKLLKRNFSDYPLWHSITELRRGEEGEVAKSEISIFSSKKSVEEEINVNDTINEMCNKYIHRGDSIYLLRFTCGDKVYNQYIFVDAVTKKVADDLNPFNLKVPLYHIKYCEKE